MTLLEEARAAARRAPFPDNDAMILSAEALLHSASGDVARAEKLYAQAINLNEQTGNQFFLAGHTASLGSLYLKGGKEADPDPDKAFTCFEDALEIARRSEYYGLQAISSHQLAEIYLAREDREAAVEYLAEAAGAYGKSGQTALSLELGLRALLLKKRP